MVRGTNCGDDYCVWRLGLRPRRRSLAPRGVILALAPGGPTWFIVERRTEGFTQGKPEDKHGIRASNTAALYLDDVFVPADRLVGIVVADPRGSRTRHNPRILRPFTPPGNPRRL